MNKNKNSGVMLRIDVEREERKPAYYGGGGVGDAYCRRWLVKIEVK